MHNEWKEIADTEIQATKNEVLNPVVAALVQKHAEGKELFDYGCGLGEFADLMQKTGFKVTAFDDADEMVEKAKSLYSKPTFLLKKELENQFPELKGSFDVVVSNLVLCILERPQQEEMLFRMRNLVKSDGLIVLSFCHPKYDYLLDSLVTERTIPEGASYEKEFRYEKKIKENGISFHDYHRPLEYYEELFARHGLTVLETQESDTLGTEYKADFIVLAFKID